MDVHVHEYKIVASESHGIPLTLAAEFGQTLDGYRQQLGGVLASMREGLKLDMTAAAEQVGGLLASA